MPNYRKPAKELVYDLINAENPQLPKPLSPNNATLGTPVAISGASYPAANTKLQITAKGNDFVGKQTVNYRRLDLTSIFRGMVVVIPKYKDITNSSSGSTVFTAYQLLADVNSRYGLSLTEDDIADIEFTRGTTLENGKYTTVRTISAKATSLGFTGTFILKWINTNQRLDDLITVPSLDGRSFPGGNDFTPGVHKRVVSSVTYGLNGDQLIDSIGLWAGNKNIIYSGGTYNATTTWFNALFSYINTQFGTDFATDLTNTEMGLLGTAGLAVVILPRDTAPEANSVDYNRVIIVDIPEALYDRIGVGRFYFHYNA